MEHYLCMIGELIMSDRNSISKRGFVDAFASNSASSERSRIVKNYWDFKIEIIEEGSTINKNSGKHRRTKQNNKCAKIASLHSPICKNPINLSVNSATKLFYSTGVIDAAFHLLLSNVKGSYKVLNVYDELIIEDCVVGSKLMESEFVPVYLLLPRNIIISNTPSQHVDILHLKKLLMKYNNNETRGKHCSGLATKYATLGVHCNRNRPGLSNTLIHEDCIGAFTHIHKMLKRVQHFAAMFLPYGLLSTLQHVKEATGDQSTLNPGTKGPQDVWASLATSYNYVSPMHTDRDSFLSCLLVSHVSSNEGKCRQKIKLDSPVAVYFCFPGHGIAVALRPGDVLFFNPLYPHCLSQRTKDYLNEEVFVTSFYIKTGQMSGNDKSVSNETLFEKLRNGSSTYK